MTKKEYNQICSILTETIYEIHDENMQSIADKSNPHMNIEELYKREMAMGYFGARVIDKLKKML